MDKIQKSIVKRITVLHPFPPIRLNNQKADNKLRVAAYCRVSSASDEQLVSYHTQLTYYNLVDNRTDLSPEENPELICYRQARMKALLEEHGSIKAMPYDLMLKVLDHIEAHSDYLEVIFLAGNAVRVDLPKSPKPHPRWTHTKRAKTPMARRRMELGLTLEQLAKLAGTSRTYLQRVETGRSKPSPELAQRINGILGMVIL